MGTIVPVILSGGAGSRLWPLSRSLYPKQLLPLNSPKTMLQETAARVSGQDFAAPIVVCNHEHRFIVAEQLRDDRIAAAAIILEPVGRNTAPAVAVAAITAIAADPHATILVLPSDHVIADIEAFTRAASTGVKAVKAGRLVTFGIEPNCPETGYGYIKTGAAEATAPGCFSVADFIEKPDASTAERFLLDGGYLWNSGIFLFSAQRYLDELERFNPGIVIACKTALGNGGQDLDFFRLDRAAFEQAEALSIDYAVMEKTADAAVVPVSMGWNDVGSWSALWDIGEHDQNGNVINGDVVTHETENSYIRSRRGLVAVVGLKDIIVANTEDAVLVASKDKAQDVKIIVDQLIADGRSEPLYHTRVYRPWGWYQTLETGDKFQVKQITVKPGAKLSLQKHRHRAEHWVVVTGVATVTKGENRFDLRENESTFIPIGETHRLENVTESPVSIIEVQSGDYLGEDDIIRLEDTYGRIDE
jgi:mannose-1-phosphate guanylyltransferase/mannose-6-phosphate isomerase